MARHLFFRSRFYLHMFQLAGYSFRDYTRWLKHNWSERVITTEHVTFLAILFALIAFVSDRITGSAATLIIGIFGISWFGPADYYGEGGEKKPLVFTARMTRLVVPFGILVAFIPMLSTQLAFQRSLLHVDMQLLGFGWLLADLLVPFFIYIGGAITYPLERMIHRYYKNKARNKLRSRSDLTVVAITGSYGKTSTKFMIRDLLSERYNVCATPSSYNTPMGICKVINNQLSRQHQVLVLEMGARYPGNIAELCQIARPDIAVVTNVGIAHLETFGSVDKIAKTKSELVEHLVSEGTAVLNAEDDRVTAMASLREDIEIVYTGIAKGEIQATQIRYDETGTRFTLLEGNEEAEISMSLLGKHNVVNMLQATAVARYFGLRLETIKVGASKVEPVEHRLELKKEGDLTVIDDAFNSNPVGARNAVDTLSQFPDGRKIIITPGMIELGEREAEENHSLGIYMGRRQLDLYILVGDHRTQPLVEGLKEANVDEERIIVSPSLFEANRVLRSWAEPGDVVLYENDLPDSYTTHSGSPQPAQF